MNVDYMRTRQKRTEIIKRIHNLNTDISRIQETHDAIAAKTKINEYILYKGKASDLGNDAQNTTPNTDTKHQKIQQKGRAGWQLQ